MKVLLVCYANTCRSPVAAALLRSSLTHDDMEILSRGVAGGDGQTPEALTVALERHGVVLSEPTGVLLTREDARSADLLLFLERRLLREAVVTDPSLWPRSFTLREFARRAMINPPEQLNESFDQWRTLLHATRKREDLLGESPQDDVSDPGLMGDDAQFEAMIVTLQNEISRVAPLLSGWPSSAS